MKKKTSNEWPKEALDSLKPPTIYEHQLVPYMRGGRSKRPLYLNESYIMCFSGPRGSGKSMSLSYVAMLALAQGMKVWLNYPLAFTIVRKDGMMQYMKADKLNFDDIMKLSPEFRGGLIGIDEYQDWDSAYMFQSTQSRLLHAMWAQIRKNQLSMAYVSKKLWWVGLKTREETDIEINCMDAAKTGGGYSKYDKGEIIYWDTKDVSGNWTGYMNYDRPVSYPFRFYAKPVWGSYNTSYRFDFMEAIRGVKLALTKRIIGDGNEDDAEDDDSHCLTYHQMKDIAQKLVSENKRVPPSAMWNQLGVRDQDTMTETREMLNDWGVEERIFNGQKYFVVSKPKLKIHK